MKIIFKEIFIWTSSNGWFNRGGNYSNGANAGVFNFSNDNGNANVNNGARAVLLQDYNDIPFGDNKIRMKIIFKEILALSSSNGWFNRGGHASNGTNDGVFAFNNNNGNANDNNGARAVLLQDYNILPFGDFSKCEFKDLHHKF